MPRNTKTALAASLLSLLVMSACTDSGPGPSPVVTPVPVTVPVSTVLSQPTVSGLRPGFGSFLDFNVPNTGTLDADFNWTFTNNDVDIYLTTPSCPSVSALTTPGGCSILASDQTLQKPARFSFTVTQAGAARFWVVNLGSSNESGSGTLRLTR